MKTLGNGQIQYSPSDLIKFLECQHASFLDRKDMDDKMESAEDSQLTALLQQKGIDHERNYLQGLEQEGKSVVSIPDEGDMEDRAKQTVDALKSGADVIYQGVLLDSPWGGISDFLIRCDSPSDLGDFSYEVLDTKLSRKVLPKHILQLCIYSEILADIQNNQPQNIHVVLGNGEKHSFKLSDFSHYCNHTKKRFESFVHNLPEVSYPEPCSYCKLCNWNGRCEEQWIADNHLSLVANIQRTQADKLRNAGIATVSDLAEAPQNTKIPTLNNETFQRLRAQAILQNHRETTGNDKFELIELKGEKEGDKNPPKGFARLPDPNPGDMFFDMEGDPLYPDGLEYLFGVYYLENGEEKFVPIWAHSHEEEAQALVKFMEFVDTRLSKYSDAHIYHYNHYETNALKRLACRYASREEQLDNLLRNHKFVDLHTVVREGIRTSEPGYSIKNLETFYMGKRESEIASADQSIVEYDRWSKTEDDQLLQNIADYNKKDCESTKLLRDWLLKHKPEGVTYISPEREKDEKSNSDRNDWEVEYEVYQKRLLSDEQDPSGIRSRITHLLEFHNREDKSQWWNLFDRQGRETDQLIEDAECIGGMQLIGNPEPLARSLVYTYKYPPQDFKLKSGSKVKNVYTRGYAGTIEEIDDTAHVVKLKLGAMNELPESLSIGPSGPIGSKPIRKAIYRYADQFLESPENELAVTELLKRNVPKIIGKQDGEDIVTSENHLIGTLEAIAAMNNSYLFIQGPPGAGKTYTSSHIIVDLIKMGKKIGITSNSHKAIHNLLDKVVEVAKEKGVAISGVKKASSQSQDSEYPGDFFKNVFNTSKIDLSSNVFAGTAWNFADPHFIGQLDYLFIDEAGQVSTANVVAMSSSTKNIILVGDQMQLAQPIQGIHPGEAGQSVLEFLLQGQSTIPSNRGIFLEETRRMRPSICKFISDAFYDSRLNANKVTDSRSLNLSNVNLPNEGIVVIPVEHEGCSQKSEKEGEKIKAMYDSLLGQDFTDNGNTRPITVKDIMVVAPYNVQVNYLRSILPEGTSVGTIDKFQGQEAPIVLISMTTSSVETLPRNIEFLYSKNRLNVAISRAQCLAVVVMNPKLLETPCRNVEQMKLVNTFCWLNEYAHPGN